MTTLITGGTGKTGLILAKLLTKAGQPVLLTSRKGVAPAPFRAVKFDWYDQSTFAAPFDVKAEVADDAGPAGLTLAIDRIYIIAPDTLHPGPIAKPFIDLAIVNGVKRFVLLGGTHQSSGSLDTGEVQQLLEESGAEYAVLKATWFQGVSWLFTFLYGLGADTEGGTDVMPQRTLARLSWTAYGTMMRFLPPWAMASHRLFQHAILHRRLSTV